MKALPAREFRCTRCGKVWKEEDLFPRNVCGDAMECVGIAEAIPLTFQISDTPEWPEELRAVLKQAQNGDTIYLFHEFLVELAKFGATLVAPGKNLNFKVREDIIYPT